MVHLLVHSWREKKTWHAFSFCEQMKGGISVKLLTITPQIRQKPKINSLLFFWREKQ